MTPTRSKRAIRAMILALSLGAMGLAGCPKNLEQSAKVPACVPVKLQAGSLGSWENPVRCHGPEGEVAYLERLRGPDGRPVRYRRTGNLGRGVHGSIVDRFIVQSADGTLCKEVIMEMYFRDYVEDRPIEGFFLHDQVF
jgi:hypothetical protein